MADLRGARGAPPGSKFFQFHAVFGKFWQNRMLAPSPGELAPPPRGNPGSTTDNHSQLSQLNEAVILIKLFLSLSSPPVFEFRPPLKQHSAVAISIYIYSVYIYILFISKRVWGHYGKLISVKIQ